MTVAALASVFESNGNGVTTVFPVPCRYLSTAHLEVKRINADGTVTTLVLGVDYTATAGPTDAGGSVTCTVAPPVGSRLRRKRVTPRSQSTDYTTGDDFPAESHEAALDRAMLVDQEQDDKILDTAARALLWPEGEVASVLGAKASFIGKYFAGDASGNPVPSLGTGNDAALRGDLAAAAGDLLIGGLDQSIPLNALRYAPSLAIAAQILAGTYNEDIVVAGWLQTAAAAAVAQNRALKLPAGTWTWKGEWNPPAGLRVVIDGLNTRFKQLDTGAVATRFIKVKTEGVVLWPGQIAFFDGQMNNVPAGAWPGRNASSFNNFVSVEPDAGTTINRFVMGDAWGYNVGGDVVLIGPPVGAEIISCEIGNIYGNNVYQSLLSVTAGRFGRVGRIFQMGGLGFHGFNVEPNPTSPRIESWYIEACYASRFSVVGDPSVPIGKIHIGKLHLDGDVAVNPDSVPAFPFDTAQSQGRGGQYRCVTHLKIDQFTAKNHAYGALWDIGAGADPMTEHLEIGQGEAIACGATYGFNFQIAQRTRKVSFGSLADGTKATPGVTTFLCSSALPVIEVNGGRINGHVAITNCLLRLKDMALDGDTGTLVRECSGKVEMKNCTITDSTAVFTNVTARPLIEDCAIAATAFKTGTTPNALVKRSTINGTYTENGLDTKTVAALPAAASFGGMRLEVTDSTVVAAANFGAIVAGGGANRVPVYSDNANWRIG